MYLHDVPSIRNDFTLTNPHTHTHKRHQHPVAPWIAVVYFYSAISKGSYLFSELLLIKDGKWKWVPIRRTRVQPLHNHKSVVCTSTGPIMYLVIPWFGKKSCCWIVIREIHLLFVSFYSKFDSNLWNLKQKQLHFVLYWLCADFRISNEVFASSALVTWATGYVRRIHPRLRPRPLMSQRLLCYRLRVAGECV